MKPDFDRAQITDAAVERALKEMFRFKGWLLPVRDEHVRALDDEAAARRRAAPEEVSRALERFDSSLSRQGSSRLGFWSHPSVLALTDGDPVDAIVFRARGVVLEAMESGWSGPPYDPFALAESLGIRLLPTEDVMDAQTTAGAGGTFTLRFNPSRPPARVRFSVAHELGHTLFPDCASEIRNRATHENMLGDEWQLEMLCNIAASEILMPFGTLRDVVSVPPGVDKICELRDTYQVSAEAMMFRLARITNHPCCVFAARFDSQRGKYKVDYSVCSSSWRLARDLKPGLTLPKDSSARECTAIDYTAKGIEKWFAGEDPWYVEYLGIPPYPGHLSPRVVGIAKPIASLPSAPPRVTYLRGDASEPVGKGAKIIVQVVNDKALTWGAGFSMQLRRKWPHAQQQFSAWALSEKPRLRLGSVHLAAVDSSLWLASVVAQHGYGPSRHPRVRYKALLEGLENVAQIAKTKEATIHMPRIGSGLAGGSWEIVEQIVDEVLCVGGLPVSVYDHPSRSSPAAGQKSLLFER